METICLKVTRLPPGGAESASAGSGKPLFRGNGDTDYLCGHCGAVIAARMAPGQHVIVDATICSGCGAENEFPSHLRA
jgi:DNA-directed RNA polymerase subunit RPC12/RpoP